MKRKDFKHGKFVSVANPHVDVAKYVDKTGKELEPERGRSRIKGSEEKVIKKPRRGVGPRASRSRRQSVAEDKSLSPKEIKPFKRKQKDEAYENPYFGKKKPTGISSRTWDVTKNYKTKKKGGRSGFQGGGRIGFKVGTLGPKQAPSNKAGRPKAGQPKAGGPLGAGKGAGKKKKIDTIKIGEHSGIKIGTVDYKNPEGLKDAKSIKGKPHSSPEGRSLSRMRTSPLVVKFNKGGRAGFKHGGSAGAAKRGHGAEIK